MKRFLAALMIMLLPISVLSAQSGTLDGSKHDFIDGQTTSFEFRFLSSVSGASICQACHMPHNADQATSPLWAHNNNTANFSMYTSGTLQGTVDGSPGGVSKACLGCHDGNTALNNYDGPGGVTDNSGDAMTGSAAFGLDLRNDHPISISYNSASSGGDPDLRDAITASTGVLRDGKVECSSCHDPHEGVGNAAGYFLRDDKASLCVGCHAK